MAFFAVGFVVASRLKRRLLALRRPNNQAKQEDENSRNAAKPHQPVQCPFNPRITAPPSNLTGQEGGWLAPAAFLFKVRFIRAAGPSQPSSPVRFSQMRVPPKPPDLSAPLAAIGDECRWH